MLAKDWIEATLAPESEKTGSPSKGESLQDQLEAYRHFVAVLSDALPLSLLVLDTDLTVRSANRHFFRASRKKRVEVVGRRLSEVFGDLLPATYLKNLTAQITKVLENGQLVEGKPLEYRTRIYLPRVCPLKSNDGSIKGLLIFEDMTEKAKMEETMEAYLKELQRTKEHLEQILYLAADAIFSFDGKGTVTSWNQACQDLFGYRTNEAVGQNVGLVANETDFLQSLVSSLEDGEGGLWEGELNLRRKDGSEFLGWLRVRRVSQGKDDELTYLAACRDVTERKELDEALRKTCEKLTQANKKLRRSMRELKAAQDQLIQAEKLSALGELLSGFTHELNNPLTVVIGYAELLMGEELEPRLRADLKELYDQAVRCQRIVENLLTFARKETPRKEPLKVNEVLESSLDLLAYKLKVDDVKVVKRMAKDLPQIWGDFHLLQQVFFNLINNAYQAMATWQEERRIDLITERRGDRVVAVVRDTGPGIKTEDLKKLFDPFFTTKGPKEGTGLGLAVSYGIIKVHGGEIRAKSMPGKGATMTVELPVKD